MPRVSAIVAVQGDGGAEIGAARAGRGRRLPATLALAAALTAPVLLSGCSAQWASMSPSIAKAHRAKVAAERSEAGTSSTTATTAAPAGPSASTIGSSTTASVTADPFATGDLSGGSLTHQLTTGNSLLVVHYWTDSHLSTEAGDSVVHVSATLKGADRKHAVKVTQFAATVDTTSDGAQTGSVQLADDRGEFVLTPPYSYTTALALPDETTTTTVATPIATSTSGPAAAATAPVTTRTLSIRFDLLVETAPGSGAYFRQTVLDSVVLSRGTEGVSQ